MFIALAFLLLIALFTFRDVYTRRYQCKKLKALLSSQDLDHAEALAHLQDKLDAVHIALRVAEGRLSTVEDLDIQLAQANNAAKEAKSEAKEQRAANVLLVEQVEGLHGAYGEVSAELEAIKDTTAGAWLLVRANRKRRLAAEADLTQYKREIARYIDAFVAQREADATELDRLERRNADLELSLRSAGRPHSLVKARPSVAIIRGEGISSRSSSSTSLSSSERVFTRAGSTSTLASSLASLIKAA